MIEVGPEVKERHCFYKERKNDKIWWVDFFDEIGRLAISFDKKSILNLFTDYPHKFTLEEKELFDKENPYWKKFWGG